MLSAQSTELVWILDFKQILLLLLLLSLQWIQQHFDDLWGERPIHCWGKKPMGGLLPQLSFHSTSCTGVFYRPMFVVFSSMTRTHKRKTKRVCYSQDGLQRALEAIRNGMSVRNASLHHGVSEKTYSEAWRWQGRQSWNSETWKIQARS